MESSSDALNPHLSVDVLADRRLIAVEGLFSMDVSVPWPSEPRGAERVCITLIAEHTDNQIDGLVDALAGVLRGEDA